MDPGLDSIVVSVIVPGRAQNPVAPIPVIVLRIVRARTQATCSSAA